MSEWQPIETAPKDGTWLLLWINGHAGLGCWMDAIPADEYGRGIDARWETDGEGFTIYPTHWMPLPEPPK